MRKIFGVVIVLAMCCGLFFGLRKEWEPWAFSKILSWKIQKELHKLYPDQFYCQKIEGNKKSKETVEIKCTDFVWTTTSVKAFVSSISIEVDMTKITLGALLWKNPIQSMGPLFFEALQKFQLGAGRLVLPSEGNQITEITYLFPETNCSFSQMHGEGVFSLFYQDLPCIEGKWRREKEKIYSEIKAQAVSFESLARLCNIFAPFLKKEAPLTGVMTAQANLSFLIGKKEIENAQIAAKCVGENLSFSGEVFPFSIEKAKMTADFKGEIRKGENLSSLFKKIEGKLSIDQAETQIADKVKLSHCALLGFFDPSHPPQFSMTALLQGEKDPLALKIETKGEWHDASIYSIKSELSLKNRQGITCSSLLSFSAIEQNTFLVEFQTSHLFATQAEMLKGWIAKYLPQLSLWEIQKGECEGSFAISFEKGKLAQIEVRQMGGKNLVISHLPTASLLPIEKLEGKGYFAEEGEWFFSTTLPFSSLCSLFSKEIEGEYLKKEPLLVELSANAKMRQVGAKSSIETVGSLRAVSLNETMQFGFKSRSWALADLQEIEDGWAHSEHLTSAVYAPFLAYFCPECRLSGTLDLIATYSKQQMEWEAKVDQCVASVGRYYLKSERIGEIGKTKGRLKGSFDCKQNRGEIIIPLSSATISDQTQNLSLSQVKADLHLSFDRKKFDLKADLKEGIFHIGKTPVLQKMQGHFSYDNQHSLFQKAKGEVLFPSVSPLIVEIASLSTQGGEIVLLQGKEALARLTLAPFMFENEPLSLDRIELEGILSLEAVLASSYISSFMDPSEKENNKEQGSCPVALHYPLKGHWNLKENALAFQIASKETELYLKKEPQSFSLEQFRQGKRISHLLLRPQEKGFAISHLEWQFSPSFSLIGKGKGVFSFPSVAKEQNDFWNIEGEIGFYFLFPEFRWHTAKPFRFALNPSLGCVASNVELISGENRCVIDCIEVLFGAKKINIHKAKGSFDKEQMALAIKANLVPSWIEEISCLRQVNIETHGEIQQGNVNWVGVLLGSALWKEPSAQDLMFEWKQDFKTATFSIQEMDETEGLLFQLYLDQSQKFHLQNVKGMLGGMNIYLKKQGVEGFKGYVDLDFQRIKQLCDIPLNQILDPWHLGKGYRLEGIFSTPNSLRELEFKGKLLGSQSECRGHLFRSLEAKLDFSPDRIGIENFDLSDPLGKIWIAEALLQKEQKSRQWFFQVPLIEMRGVSPALFERKASIEREAGPFVLKSVEVHQLRGKVGDLASLTGYGQFQFINKGVGTIEGGKDLFSRWGETSDRFFVPAIGKAQYTILHRRCYLQEIKEVYGEQKKIEFFVPQFQEQVGYIDFDGNLQFDLQLRPMGRKEMRKGDSTSAWLHIGGTWKEPKLSTTATSQR